MKKVFLICPKFHNFENEIVAAMRRLGYEVTFFCEKPYAVSGLFHSLYMKSPGMIRKLITKRYFKKLLSTFDDTYNYFILVRGEVVPEWFLREAKKKAAESSKFIMYQWDFLDAVPNVQNLLKYFDKIYTFDYLDAKKYGLIFKPLFYTQSHVDLSNKYNAKYSVSFVGTHHSDRYEIIERFFQHNGALLKSSFVSLYRPLYSFLYNKIIGRDLGKLPISRANKRLSEARSKAIMAQSAAVLDIHHVKQSGVTIRTLEAIGLKKKLITTNPYIIYHDFYNENNVCIISRDDMRVPPAFLLQPYVELKHDIYAKYHVNNWVKEFFDAAS